MERQIQFYREENITPDVLVGKITGYCMEGDVWEEQNIKQNVL